MRAAGIVPVIGHDAANVPAGDDVEVVVSTAIAADNPERAAGRDRGLRELHRGALLGELSRLRRTIAIAGTHGKTTTTSMVAHALLALGWEPSYLIGGELRRRARTRPGARASGSSSRPTSPTARCSRSQSEIAVVTNVELDHHTTYPSLAELEEAFGEFLCNGLRRVVADTPAAEAFLDRVGINEAAFYGASEIELHAGGSRFAWAERRVGCRCPARTTSPTRRRR